MKKYYLLDAVNLLLSFLLCRWLFMRFLFDHFVRITMVYSFWPSLLAVLVMTLVLFTAGQFLYRTRVSKIFIAILYTIYGLIVSYLLFFKSIGVAGFNLNLIQYFLVDMMENPSVVLFNFLFFLPLGFLFRPSWKHLLSFIIFISLAEIAQYFFRLGFFDLGDILINTLGFLLGTLLSISPIGRSIKKRVA